jgi:chorismate mutase
MVRAVRGAITVSRNGKAEIYEAVKELVGNIFEINAIAYEDMISMLFTVTKDLDAVFPAAAVRDMGIVGIPMMCSCEIRVRGSLKKCIRVMVHFNTDKKNEDIRHIYLRLAKDLRPDLTGDKHEKIQNSD